MTDQQRAAMQEALKALMCDPKPGVAAARAEEILRAALAEPEQEPVAYLYVGGTVFGELDDYEIEDRPGICEALNEANYGDPKKLPLYTEPPRREWVGLTEEEVKRIVSMWSMLNSQDKLAELVRMTEAALKEKNGGHCA